jgi:drug/metabolite transporter (DMT)-like permease
VIYRRFPATPSSAPAIVSSLLLSVVALAVTDVFDAPTGEIPVMVGFGLVQAIAFVTLAEGARYLPAAETGLLSALETPLAPVWAWLLLSEIPNSETILGGSIILAAVFWRR